jgi:HK97 gp10 family phage protein
MKGDSVKIDITGGTELLAKLQTLESKTQNKFINKSLRAGAKIVQKEAKANAPVSDSPYDKHIGLLKKSIRIRAGKRNKFYKTIKVQLNEKDYSGDTFYASFIEFGTHKIKAAHFLENAFKSTQKQSLDAVTDTMAKLIEEEAANG